MSPFIKYPRTEHLAGSRVLPGIADDGRRLDQIQDGEWVWEEKLDGQNTGISFDEDANLILQSRGHLLSGAPLERALAPFNAWVSERESALFDILGTRYLMFCEFMGAKHTIYYDALPDLVLEEDIYDRETGQFLSTDQRHGLLAGGPVCSVPVIHRGKIREPREVEALVGRSLYVSDDWHASLRQACERAGSDVDLEISRTDNTGLAEGVYLKVESADMVVGRFKWVRPSFLSTILSSGGHWRDRAIVANSIDAIESSPMPRP